ncbi:MAG: hypothetical protein IJ929_06570, partial [Prevotella sp.]|nr:hypothetical protein [Prevotella sp.]
IFLNENFEMRKNLMTGVAEYREKYSDDQRFKPLTEEVRNDMTMRATELGLKSWDRVYRHHQSAEAARRPDRFAPIRLRGHRQRQEYRFRGQFEPSTALCTGPSPL